MDEEGRFEAYCWCGLKYSHAGHGGMCSQRCSEAFARDQDEVLQLTMVPSLFQDPEEEEYD